MSPNDNVRVSHNNNNIVEVFQACLLWFRGWWMRWAIERTNSWLSNFGQLRHSTDRNTTARLGQLALAVALIITVNRHRRGSRSKAQDGLVL